MIREALDMRAHVRDRLRAHFDRPLEAPEALLKEVANHGRVLEIVYKKKRPHRLGLARFLCQSLEELLAGWQQLSLQHQKLLQSACLYFVENQPAGDHDLAADTGLDDDLEVFTAVVKSLGRVDLAEGAHRAAQSETA